MTDTRGQVRGIRDKVWQRRVVAGLGGQPQPAFAPVEACRVVTDSGEVDLAEALLARPGSYILKPRFGSNGVGVVRVVSHPNSQLIAESDCPETAAFLEEYLADPQARGRDVVAAAATLRARYLDPARPGVPERLLRESILEDEITRDEAAGCVFEPRVVIQRADGDSFTTLGAICKVVDTPVGACVARGFREVPVSDALTTFLTPRVPPEDLEEWVRRVSVEVTAAGDRIGAAFARRMSELEARIHQFGIDVRLCWDAIGRRVVLPFLEVQFGIGRIDLRAEGAELSPSYLPPQALRDRFGPEVG